MTLVIVITLYTRACLRTAGAAMGTCTACSVLDGGVGRLGAPRRRALPFRLRSILASTCDPPTTESVSSDVGNRDYALHTRMSEDSRCCHGHRHGWQRAWRWCGHTCEGYRKNFLLSAGNQSKENFSCNLPHQGNQSAGSRKTYPSPTHMMSLCPVPWMPRQLDGCCGCQGAPWWRSARWQETRLARPFPVRARPVLIAAQN